MSTERDETREKRRRPGGDPAPHAPPKEAGCAPGHPRSPYGGRARTRPPTFAVLGDGLLDRADDAVGLERLDDEVLRTGLDRLEHLALLPEGGAHDDPRPGVQGDDLLEGGEAVLLRHGD